MKHVWSIFVGMLTLSLYLAGGALMASKDAEALEASKRLFDIAPAVVHVHTANEHERGGHTRHRDHNHEHHEQDHQHPAHGGCSCPGTLFCSLQADLSNRLGPQPRIVVGEISQHRLIGVAFSSEPKLRLNSLDDTPRSIPPPPNKGWRTSLYASVPRLRI